MKTPLRFNDTKRFKMTGIKFRCLTFWACDAFERHVSWGQIDTAFVWRPLLGHWQSCHN